MGNLSPSNSTRPAGVGKKLQRKDTLFGGSNKDPRWDTDGFNRWGSEGEIAWVKVGYLRKLAAANRAWARRQDLPTDALHIGVPPENVQLYAVSMIWGESQVHSDPDGTRLRR